jgi:hypothetical protein
MWKVSNASTCQCYFALSILKFIIIIIIIIVVVSSSSSSSSSSGGSVGQDSSVGIVVRYGLHGPEIEFR